MKSHDQSRIDSYRKRFREEIFLICGIHNITPHDLWGKDKKHKFVCARREFCFKLRERGISIEMISNILNRDHTSICYLLGTKNRNVKMGRPRAFKAD